MANIAEYTPSYDAAEQAAEMEYPPTPTGTFDTKPVAYVTRVVFLDNKLIAKIGEQVQTFYVERTDGRYGAARQTARSVAHLLNEGAGSEVFYVRPTDEGASVYGARNTLAALVTAKEA